ncbi:Conserved_hypothetical protein [Hexamita inflata]|uniref:Uncharacterized protein n=1 Tax=Hexamita inflata TaxID=28002 RepID=A0AA86VS24_9EUKA|nr:Conserved hypothetical protein [Hexamita inflata]
MLQKEFVSKSPSIDEDRDVHLVFNPIGATEISLNPQLDPVQMRMLPVEQRRILNEQYRCKRAQEEQINAILRAKMIYEATVESTTALIERQKLRSEVLINQQSRNDSQLSAKASELEIQRAEKIQQMQLAQAKAEQAHIQQLVAQKQRSVVPQSNKNHPPVSRLVKQATALVNNKQKRAHKIEQRENALKNQQIEYLLKLKTQEANQKKQSDELIQQQKQQNATKTRRTVLFGEKMDELHFKTEEKREKQLKTESIKLKEKYEKEKEIGFDSKQAQKDRIRQITELKSQMRKENNAKYQEQLKNDFEVETKRQQQQEARKIIETQRIIQRLKSE